MLEGISGFLDVFFGKSRRLLFLFFLGHRDVQLARWLELCFALFLFVLFVFLFVFVGEFFFLSVIALIADRLIFFVFVLGIVLQNGDSYPSVLRPYAEDAAAALLEDFYLNVLTRYTKLVECLANRF